jgi:polyisoprenoid-binding protein YceI
MSKLSLVMFMVLLSSLSYGVTWVTNKDHSEIKFEVPYMGVSEISGRFNEFSGEVQFKDDAKTADQLEVKIRTASIDTGNKMRDGHLRGSDFFQSLQFPIIAFKSKNISLIKPDSFRAIGEMTIRGVTKPSIIEFTTTNSLKDTWGYENKFVKFKSKINRNDFKLKWNKTLADQKYLVGDVVSIQGTFQIQPATHLTPTNKHMIPDTKYIRSREREARGEIQVEKFKVESDEVNNTKKIVYQAPSPSSHLAPAVDFRESRWWWVSLSVIGLLGFFGVLGICFYTKNKIAESFPVKYEENGILGYVSDFIVILMVSIFSVALWFLGWGIR